MICGAVRSSKMDDSPGTGLCSWIPQDGEADPLRSHPTAVAESSALQAIPLPPVEYVCRHVGESIHLSQMQVETVAIAMSALLRRGTRGRTFALGDGTGLGKGRCLAAIAREWRGHHGVDGKVLWVSANLRLGEQTTEELGLFLDGEQDAHEKRWFRFESYMRLKNVSVRDECISWIQQSTQASTAAATARVLVCLDECHLLRRRKLLFRALAEILHTVPGVAVLYSSATMMSDPSHMLYLSQRLPMYRGADAPFESTKHMQRVLNTGGTSVLELVAMYLRSQGVYLARQLSLHGVDVDSWRFVATSKHRRLYDLLARSVVECGVPQTRAQHVLLRLIAALKVTRALARADEFLQRGWSVIFSLARTGEATTERNIERGALCPSSCVSDFARYLSQKGYDSWADALDQADFPMDAIDQIVEHFGDQMAEITGRRQRYSRTDASGAWRIEACNRNDDVRAFQSGQKRVAVLSRAGGLGLSLHDVGGGRRVNIILEAPWNAEDFVQLMGRCYRSGCASFPMYVLCLLDIPSEQRVFYSLSRRIGSLGALTRSDRGSCDTLNLLSLCGRNTTRQSRRCLSIKLALQVLMEMSDAPIGIPTTQELQAANDRALSRWYSTSGGESTSGAYRSTVLFMDLAHCITRMEHLNGQHDDVEAHEDSSSSVDSDADVEQVDEVGGIDATRRSVHRLLLMALARVPQLSARIVLHPWAPEKHRLYGRRDHDIVKALLLVANRSEASNTLGALPCVVLHLIIEMVLDENDDANRITQFYRKTSRDLLRLHHMARHEDFMNSVMLLPIDGQQSAIRLSESCLDDDGAFLLDTQRRPLTRRNRAAVAVDVEEDDDDEVRQCPSHGRAQFIEQVASERAGRGIRATVHEVTPLSQGDHIVHMHYTPIARAEPPDNAIVWRHRRTGTLYWQRPGSTEAHGADDARIVIDSTNEVYYVPSTREAFNMRQARHARRCRAKTDQLCTRFRISTVRALHMWDESLKKVVRVSIPTQRGESVVTLALLVSIEP